MRLIEALEIVHAARPEGVEVMKIFLACGFTPLHLQTLVMARLQQRFNQREVRVETGIYGDCLTNVERFDHFDREATLVVIEWADLDPRLGLRRLSGWNPAELPDILSTVDMLSNQLCYHIERVAEFAPVVVAPPSLPLPPVSYTPGWQSDTFELSLHETVSKMASSLAAITSVRVISREMLDILSPMKHRLDVKSALNSDFPYSFEHADALSDVLVRAAFPHPAKKGLITDLDDTLWRGIIGEVGVDGISWDLDHHSQAHGLYQQMLRSLTASGTVIAVASKNSSEVAMQGLTRPDMVLPVDRVYPIECQWAPKSESVTRILQTWNISADSVVFVDDNPAELAEVQSAHPEVLTLRFPHGDVQAKLLSTARKVEKPVRQECSEYRR